MHNTADALKLCSSGLIKKDDITINTNGANMEVKAGNSFLINPPPISPASPLSNAFPSKTVAFSRWVNGLNYLRFQKHDRMFPNTTILVVIQSTIRTKQFLNKHCVTSVRCSTFLLAVVMFESSRFSSRGGPLSAKTKKRATRIKIISFDLLTQISNIFVCTKVLSF